MTEEEYLEAVATCSLGKRLPGARYLHRSLVPELPVPVLGLVERIANAVNLKLAAWNVVKLHTDQFKLSFLNYPNFEDESYPALHASKVIDLKRKSVRDLTFGDDPNPPILHRKELMVPDSHPKRADFVAITEEGELAGLYENSRRIGFRRDWERAIAQRGYALVDGRLFRASSISSVGTDSVIQRERTAISRSQLSAPMQMLSKYSLLDGRFSLCDYGCGRGDDLEILSGIGVDAIGWDPNFRPEGDRLPSDIVNLGYVINVIEDLDERNQALKKSFALAGRLLVVSAMVASGTHIRRYKAYKDGVITSRNTFQKYYAQAELKEYIESTLGNAAMPVASGIFFVFKDDVFEAELTFRRLHGRSTRQRTRVHRKSKAERISDIIEAHRSDFDAYWSSALELGRWPTVDEHPNSEALSAHFSTLRKTQASMFAFYDVSELEAAERCRRDELVLSQAMSFFRGRQPFRALPVAFRTDIRAFFGTYRALRAEAEELLSKLVNTEEIETDCATAFDGLDHGYLEEEVALLLRADAVADLPVALRAYIGCAEQLIGAVDTFDVIKVHMHTGKSSFMKYDGFGERPIPALIERIKVDLWNQRVSYYDYIEEYEPKPLYWQSRFMRPSDPRYIKQKGFDQRLDELGLAPENPQFGFSFRELREILRAKGLEIRGHRFYKLYSKQ